MGSQDLSVFCRASALLFNVALGACVVFGLTGCVTQSHQALQVEKPVTASVPYSGPKSAIAVGKFDNRSNYMRGLYSNVDKAHSVSRVANVSLFEAKSVGLPYGPYNPQYTKDY